MKTLEVKEITKEYGSNKAVDNLSFAINAGHIIGLLGPNGAGKTTTMSIITGILASDAGQVLFDGEQMKENNEMDLKKKIGFLSEANPLYDDMLVKEYLEFVGSLRGMSKDQLQKAIARVIKETGIEDKLSQPIEELSKGYRQRVGLAQAILHEPEILILDEPTEGLDPNQRVVIRDLIAQIGKERTVIISTHVLSEVQAMCDRVIILNRGKLVREGTVEEVIKSGQEGQKIEFEVRGHEVSSILEKSEDFTIINHVKSGENDSFTLLSSIEADLRPKLFNLVKQNNWDLFELHQEATSLEDVFRQLTT